MRSDSFLFNPQSRGNVVPTTTKTKNRNNRKLLILKALNTKSSQDFHSFFHSCGKP